MLGRMVALRSIELKTAVPGPRSQELIARHDAAVAKPLSIYLPIVVDHGRGALLTDVDGNTFIDFTGGVGCLNVGHAHPKVVAAVQQQAERFLHTDYTIVPYEVYIELAERLVALTPISRPARPALFQAGTRGGG